MSVIPTYKTVSRQDLREVPKDFAGVVDFVLKAIDPLQKQVKELTLALQKGITFGDNIRGEIKENVVVVADGAVEFTIQTFSDPLGAIGILKDGFIVLKTEKVDDRTIRITPNISGTVTILILGR